VRCHFRTLGFFDDENGGWCLSLVTCFLAVTVLEVGADELNPEQRRAEFKELPWQRGPGQGTSTEAPGARARVQVSAELTSVSYLAWLTWFELFGVLPICLLRRLGSSATVSVMGLLYAGILAALALSTASGRGRSSRRTTRRILPRLRIRLTRRKHGSGEAVPLSMGRDERGRLVYQPRLAGV
jgi:hypothetical protein